MISCAYPLYTKGEVERSVAKTIFLKLYIFPFFPCLSVRLLGLNFKSLIGLSE